MMTQGKPLNTNGANTALKVQKLLKGLIECMSQETLALRAHNQDIAGKMSKEKLRLMMTYKAVAVELQKNPDVLKALDTDTLEQLKTLLSEFELVLVDNLTAIQTGRNAVHRLINRLMTKAREAVNRGPRNYNSKGEMVDAAFKSGILPSQLNEVY